MQKHRPLTWARIAGVVALLILVTLIAGALITGAAWATDTLIALGMGLCFVAPFVIVWFLLSRASESDAERAPGGEGPPPVSS